VRGVDKDGRILFAKEIELEDRYQNLGAAKCLRESLPSKINDKSR